ncbi:NAD(P)H-dependent oxidoreductase [Chryseobacterium sp. Leaf404]|uniref:nitroreductase family protein n=1 Tax=unclassified Chryseobacterium TaxID=2593645 RepID=UPI0006F71EAB|nr:MULTISPECIES: nitroreductase family protein [unclassified Chryseobacterium]KQT20872.1 NAD(P)H-dependent oxidoreductase [Chryseobacterium sp. Leaf404]
MKLLENLNWRYTVKKFSNQKVDQEKIDKIIEAINLSASSGGLQPYRIFIIENKELQKKLRGESFNAQIEEASHVIVFASYHKMTKGYIEEFMNLNAKVRNMPISELEDYKNALEFYHLNKTEEESAIWAAKQAYIGLGTALIAAAELKVDATPMEGFDSQIVNEALSLDGKSLNSVLLLALGYRDSENDWNIKLKKVRLPIEEFSTIIK